MNNIDIYLREESGREIRIPWLPDEIEYKTNGAIRAQYKILNLGEVEVPAGRNLKTVSWSSVFPGAAHKNVPFLRGEWQSPNNYHKTLVEWKNKSTELNLIITGTKVNLDVYIEDYTEGYRGGAGDISYTIELKQRKKITVTAKTTKTSSSKSSSSSSSSSSSKKTYTIKSGDTLWGIAKKQLGSGSKYTEIYKLNKDVIEKEAKKHGKKSSDSGHWIYPGTVLKLP